ncbi:GNAT family N-acetyltransferase [Deinococcus sedimenti]|nr:GNAT family N-acetyltransferase [Deinococcus sedimenti]
MTRSLGYFTDVALRRQEGSDVQVRADCTVVRSPANPTFWWGNFLLMPALPAPGDLEAWEATFQREFPGAAHRVYGVDAPGLALSGPPAEEFRAAGYDVRADTVLTAARTHEPRRINRDAQLRVLTGDTDWAAALAMREAVNAADPHPHEAQGYRAFAARKLAAYRAAQAAGHGALLGAFDDHGRMLSGLGIFDAGDGVARYQNVETHPDARSRGLAGTLVPHAGEWAREHLHARTLVIVADPDYHAQRLYESVGFTPTELQIALEKRPLE